VHFYRPAECQAGRVCEGVLNRQDAKNAKEGRIEQQETEKTEKDVCPQITQMDAD
jgi:hypothetical protein